MKLSITNKKFEENSSKGLLIIAAIFLFILSAILTLSPSARYRSWDVNYRWGHWIGYFFWLGSTISLFTTLNRKFRDWDPYILITAKVIVGWGLITIWRLNTYFGLRQTLWLTISTIISIILLRNPSTINKLKKYKYFWLAAGLSLITLTFFFGTYPGGIGPRLWLGFKGVYFQPSEFLKIILIIYLASYFSEKPSGKFDIVHTLLPTIILVAASIVLLIAQKDLGTALIFITIYFLMVYFVYGKKRILILGGVLIIFSSVIGFFFIDLIRIRFQGWLLPWGASQTSSYQIIQSIISIASGGLFGTGIGLGYPNLVPLAHSDFIFSAIAEETGLIGSIGFISILLIFLFRGTKVSLNTGNRFYKYLSAGITIYVITQSILILGGNTRLLPITGVTLPFVSYGGSSLLTSYFALSILLIISAHTKEREILISNYQPYQIATSIFSICLIAIAMTIGWWGFIRENDIQERTDNPRHLIANTYVKRGEIFDRNSQILAETLGKVGSFSRLYSYPPLSNSIGYIDQKYGLFGIEKEYDDYLSGLKGYPASVIWLNYLIYDQPPDGRSIRLTLDLKLQDEVDNLLQNNQGAAVVLNAINGNILAISTQPYFDANQLEENWASWNNSENAPFLNRASQGAYPVSGLLSPLFLFEQEIGTIELPQDPISTTSDHNDILCNSQNTNLEEFQTSVRNGCLSSAFQLTENKNLADMVGSNIFEFIINPPITGLPANPPQMISQSGDLFDLISGDNQIRTSPLQIAASLAPLSNGGILIPPSIVSSVNLSSDQWVLIPSEEGQAILSPKKSEEISQFLVSEEIPAWEISAIAYDQENAFSWYVMGTNNNWEKTPIIIALVIENGNRNRAQTIGRAIFEAIDQ